MIQGIFLLILSIGFGFSLGILDSILSSSEKIKNGKLVHISLLILTAACLIGIDLFADVCDLPNYIEYSSYLVMLAIIVCFSVFKKHK